jgi:Flp pilus assembly protein TadG
MTFARALLSRCALKGPARELRAIRQPQELDCPHLTLLPSLLLIDFTIFLNQLDNLRDYSSRGNKPGCLPVELCGPQRNFAQHVVEETMMLKRAERFSRLVGGRQSSEGGATVACAVAMPLLVLAFAVGADYAKVSHFRSRVQVAADAASLATAETVARQRDIANDSDALADQVADFVFIGQAPRGAGTPTVAVRSAAAAVTANVGYAGLAPSNFGSAFGYDEVSVDASSTSLARVADFRSTVFR